MTVPPATLNLLDLGCRLGGQSILREVAAHVPPGRFSALVGPNGSGKSTLLRLLIGAADPSAGSVLLDGRPVIDMPRRMRAQHLALVEQDSPAPPGLTAAEAVMLGRTPYRRRGWGETDEDVAIANRALQRAGAQLLANRELVTLSGGERQRVHLARALAQQPRLLLLDEPTNHLDVAAQLEVLELVHSLIADGTTVLAALHDLNHALRFCAHVIVLEAGRVVGAGRPAEVLSEELVSRVYGVRAQRVRLRGRDMLIYEGT